LKNIFGFAFLFRLFNVAYCHASL